MSSFLSDEQLIRTIKDFFVAGVETTSSTIHWACAFFLEHPDVQTRMRKEMENVVGAGRRPKISDKESLPYCEAVIAEIRRCGNVTPTAANHTANEDVQWGNYIIPKDSMIIINLDSIQYDENVYPEPHKFKPERFLTADGKFTGTKEKLMTFGIGKFFFF